MATWVTTKHADLPRDAARVLGSNEAGMVQWLDESDRPPVNDDVPYAYQEGDVLHCTKGNWHITPSAYTYQWQIDGADFGDPLPSDAYTVTAGDIGKTFTCVVTAHNATGGTAAPPSNPVVAA